MQIKQTLLKTWLF